MTFRIDSFAGNGHTCKAKFWITTEDIPAAAPKPTAACVLPSGVPNVNDTTHICMRDGEYWDQARRLTDWPDTIGSQFYYFAFKINPNPDTTKPTTFLISTSMHAYTSFVNPFPIKQGDPLDKENIDTPFLQSYAEHDTQGGNNCKFPNICPNFVELQNGYQRDMIFTLFLNQSTWLYMAATDTEENPWLLFESRQDVVWRRTYTRALTDYNPVMYQYGTPQIAQVWCHDDNNVSFQYTYPYNYDQSNDNSMGGTMLWFPLPSADPNPFYPQLPFAWISGSQLRGRALIDGSNKTGRPNHLNFVVVTSFYPNGLGVKVSRLSNNLNNTGNCQINLHGNLVGGPGWKYGEAPADAQDFVAVYENENYKLFEKWDPTPGLGSFSEQSLSTAGKNISKTAIFKNFGDLLNQAVTATGSLLLDIEYQLDIYAFSYAISGLLESIRNSYNTKNAIVPEFNEVCFAEPDSGDFKADPCCTQGVGFTGDTCIPRSQNVTVDIFDSMADQNAICGDPECYTSYVQDIAAASQDQRLGVCSGITENPTNFQYRFFKSFADCRDMYLGKIIREPNTCFHDDDCAQWGYQCDMVRKQCLIPLEERFKNFTKCFLGSANKLLLIQLAQNVFNVDPSKDQTILSDVDKWVAQYQTTDECSDPNGFDWALPGRSSYTFGSAFKNYDMCNPTTQGTHGGIDPYPFAPWQCQAHQLGPASYGPSESSEDGCALLKTCNWFLDFGQVNPNSTDAENICLSYWGNNGSFCGITDNGWDYYPVNATQGQCGGTSVACFHADGTVTIEPDAGTCTSSPMKCTIPGAKPSDCENKAGRCVSSVATQPVPLLFGNINGTPKVFSQLSWQPATTQYTFNGHVPGGQSFYYDYGYDPVNTTGACFSPFGVPPLGFACGTSLQSGNQRMTVLGCANFLYTTELACNGAQSANPDQVFIWKDAPKTKEACEALQNVPAKGAISSNHMCKRPLDTPNIVNYFEPTIYTDQSEIACNATPGSEWAPRHVWEYGKLRSSIARPLKWVTAQYAERFTYGVTPTIALNNLVNDVFEAIADIYIFEQKSTIFCQYGRLNTALNALDCLCTSGAPAECKSNASSAAVSSGCGGASGVAFVPPASIEFSEETITPLGGCVHFAVTIASHIAYKDTQPAGVPSYFIDFSELSDYSFRNEHQALIGQIVGDGFSINITDVSPTGTITDLARVCSKVATDIPINYPDLYTVPDWATAGLVVNGVKTFNVIKTQNSTYEALSGEICARFVVEPGKLYFPVFRAANPDTLVPNVFKPAEFGLVCVLIIAFAAMIIFIFFKLRFIITIRAFPFSAGVSIPLFGLYTVRLIYFSMLVAYQFVTDTGGLGPWVLVELPLLLYFATTIYFVLNWAFVTRTIKKLGKARRIQALTVRYFAVVMAVLTAVFIAFLISFALLKPVPVTSCDGRIITIDDSIPKGIAIGYRVWMGALCAIVGIAFVSYASFILAAMQQVTSRGGNDKIARQRERSKRNLTFMAIVCSFSLFVEAVYMLVLAFYTTFDKNIVSLVIMLVTEVTPGIGILVMLDLSELAKTAELTRTQSRMTGASSSATRGTGLKSLTDAVNNASNTSNASTGSAAPTTSDNATKSASKASSASE